MASSIPLHAPLHVSIPLHVPGDSPQASRPIKQAYTR
jgi:hypothetical protein